MLLDKRHGRERQIMVLRDLCVSSTTDAVVSEQTFPQVTTLFISKLSIRLSVVLISGIR